MKNFQDVLKIKWSRLSQRDQQMAIMSALKSASAVMQGTKISPEELLEYTEKILERFYQFEFLKKPAIPKKLSDTVNEEIQKNNNQPF